MHSIVSPRDAREALRKRLEIEMRQARAGELAAADKQQRARIEREIRAELDRRLGKDRWGLFYQRPVLW
jgi:hypothetical protein